MHKPLSTYTKQEIKIQNNLPYSLLIEYCPKIKSIDTLYYMTRLKGVRLDYRSVKVEDLEGFTRLPNITGTLDEVLVQEVIAGSVVHQTSYFIENKVTDLGKTLLTVEVPENSRLNLDRELELVNTYYGPCAYPSNTKLIFDRHDMYNPATDVIHYAAGGRNLIHELIHASRKSLLISSKNGKYYEKLEMLEEFFGEGVSDQIKGLYSTHQYNYDYLINDMSLATENLQSPQGGIAFLEQCRYFLLSASYWKLNFQYHKNTSRHLAKEFNSIYYSHLSTGAEPSKEMFLSILSCLVPIIENKPTRKWLEEKPLFYTENILGDKIWFYVNDYKARGENIGICRVYSYETFENGSDWFYNGKRYSKNGSKIKLTIDRVLAKGIIKLHELETTIPLFNEGFGEVKLYLHSNLESPVSKELMENDHFPSFNFHCPEGLYRIIINGKLYYRYIGGDVDGTDCIIASTVKILEVTDDSGFKVTGDRNVLKIPNDLNVPGRIINIKTEQKTYQRIIKNGKNHLFLS